MDTEQWYWSGDGKVEGPSSVDEIAAIMATAGGKEFLVWRQGMESWADARSVSVFSLKLPPPLPAKAVSAVELNLFPWRRFFARMLDYWMFALFFGLVAGVLFPHLFRDSHNKDIDFIISFASIAFFCLVESVMVTAFGSTPGKSLYNVSLTQNGEPVNFGDALRRSARVWVRGMGVGIPIITLITMTRAYRQLKDNGSTTWDLEGGWTVKHSSISLWRWAGIAALWGLMLCVLFIGSTS